MSVVGWLLDSDPSIRWQVMRDLTDARADEVAAERARVATDLPRPARVALRLYDVSGRLVRTLTDANWPAALWCAAFCRHAAALYAALTVLCLSSAWPARQRQRARDARIPETFSTQVRRAPSAAAND